jgi:hypothetical protein
MGLQIPANPLSNGVQNICDFRDYAVVLAGLNNLSSKEAIAKLGKSVIL